MYNHGHRGLIKSGEIDDQDLDDVLLVIGGECYTAEDPDGDGDDKSLPVAFSDAGVDMTMTWEDVQYIYRHLFVKRFLEKCFEKDGGAYRTLQQAASVAYQQIQTDGLSEARADHIFTNLEWGGTVTSPENQRLFPPRYGRKDKEE